MRRNSSARSTPPIVGAYFGRDLAEAERQGRITDVPYDEAIPVHTGWDLGIGDSTAIWFFQVVGDEVHYIDHYEAHGQKLDHYLGVLSSKPYRYGIDFLPHDAKARELISGRSRVEHLANSGRAVRVLPQTKIEDGINAARLDPAARVVRPREMRRRARGAASVPRRIRRADADVP